MLVGKVIKVTVVMNPYSTDVIYIETDGPPSFPGQPLVLVVYAPNGSGMKWARTWTGVEPELVERGGYV